MKLIYELIEFPDNEYCYCCATAFTRNGNRKDFDVETIDTISKKIALLKDKLQNVKGRETEVYSRITGYYRPVKRWNPGKREEFRNRKCFKVDKEYSRQ